MIITKAPSTYIVFYKITQTECMNAPSEMRWDDRCTSV